MTKWIVFFALLAIILAAVWTFKHSKPAPNPPLISSSAENVMIGAPLDASIVNDRSAHTVPFDLRAEPAADGAITWLCEFRSAGHVARFRVELEPPYSSDQTEIVPMHFGKGHLYAMPGSEPRDLLAALVAALDARGVQLGGDRVQALPFTYVDFGAAFSLAPHGGVQLKPAGQWRAVKLFLGTNDESDEGQVYLFANPVEGKGEFAEKDAEYGDIVLRHLAKVL